MEKNTIQMHSLWSFIFFFQRSLSASPGSTYGTVVSLPLPLMIKLFSFPPKPLIPSTSSVEDPTKLSSCLIFVSKFDNALYSFFNWIEKTLFLESSVPFPWPCPPWPSKRAEEADNPSVVDDSVNADEDIDVA